MKFVCSNSHFSRANEYYNNDLINMIILSLNIYLILKHGVRVLIE